MINSVILMGRLTANPVLRVTTTGKNVCTFVIAVDRGVSKSGERTADFIPIVAWESTAIFVEKYFLKGDMIAVSGSLQTRPYEDRDGDRRTAYEVVVREISFCGKKQEPKAYPELKHENEGGYSTITAGDFTEILPDELDIEIIG